jgi:hypothetical protein
MCARLRCYFGKEKDDSGKAEEQKPAPEFYLLHHLIGLKLMRQSCRQTAPGSWKNLPAVGRN